MGFFSKYKKVDVEEAATVVVDPPLTKVKAFDPPLTKVKAFHDNIEDNSVLDAETVDESFMDECDETITTKAHKKKRRWSCCAWILLILAIVLFLMTVVIVVLLTCGYFWTKHHIDRITVTDRQNLPVHPLPDSELFHIKERVKWFVEELKAGTIPEKDLVLTQDEINGLIAESDYLSGNAYVTIALDNQVQADLSLPAQFLPGGKDRFFVGNANLEIANDDEGGALVTANIETLHPVPDVTGSFFLAEFRMFWMSGGGMQELVVNLKSGKLLNWIVPSDWIAKKENLVHSIYEQHDDDECDAARVLNGIQSVSVENGAITVHARRDSSSLSSSSSSSGGNGVRKLLSMLLF